MTLGGAGAVAEVGAVALASQHLAAQDALPILKQGRSSSKIYFSFRFIMENSPKMVFSFRFLHYNGNSLKRNAHNLQ